MKGIKRFFRAEDGVSAIVVALLMVIFLSVAALATDLGIAYYKRTELQSAVDAAALAGAYLLPDQEGASAAARNYLQLNGVNPANAQITFTLGSRGNSIIRVGYAQQKRSYFANVFGINTLNYSCNAKATTGIRAAKGAFDYLLFSGSPTGTLEMKTNFHIYGSVHSNYNFTTSYRNGYIEGAAEAVGTAYANSSVVIGALISGAPFVPMVSFTEVINQMVPTVFDQSYWLPAVNLVAADNCMYFTGRTRIFGGGNLVLKKGMKLTGSLYVEGNLYVYGANIQGENGNTCILMSDTSVLYVTGSIYVEKNFKGAGSIFAGGSINFAGGSDKLTDKKPLTLYSANGNINLNVGSTHGYGIVYAPNGNCSVGGGNTTWHGSIIGNTISYIPANLTMYANDVQLPFIIGSRTAFLIE